MKSKKRKNKSKHPFIKGFLVCVAVFAVLILGGIYLGTEYIYNKMDFELENVTVEEEETVEDVELKQLSKESFQKEGVKNILLIGNDSRKDGDDGRSDAMILVSISSKTKKIYMTSILRDIYVKIPGYSKGNRLNAAYAYGGPKLLMETLKENFDITVDRYMLVNFQAFAKVVDAVGGVDIEVTSAEVRYINSYLVEYNQLEGRPVGTDYLDSSLSGTLHLNGPQALAFCRNRYIGTDFARTERQRKVLSAIFEKAPSSLLTNTDELAEGLLSNVKTNLQKKELAGLMVQAPILLTYDMVQTTIPLDGTYSNTSIRGMSVLEVDFDVNKEYIQKEIYGK